MPRLPEPVAPPQARTSKPSGSTDLLPDGEEPFSDFCPPQFAVPANSAGEEQLRRAGLDPHLLQQMADPASALRADAHSSKQANLILRGVGAGRPGNHRWVNPEGHRQPRALGSMAPQKGVARENRALGGI